MFTKQNRLTSREFDSYFKSGRRYHSPSLQMVHAEANELKVAVVIPKKVYRSAVKRNRMRRQLYHQLRPLLLDTQGVYIFIAKPKIKEIAMSEIGGEISNLVGGIPKS